MTRIDIIKSKPVSGLSPNSREMKNYRALLTELTPLQKEVIVGLMLNGASLQTQNGGKSYRLKFVWGYESINYANHIFELFEEWFISPNAVEERVNKNDVTVNTVVNQTLSHTAFNFLHDLFIEDNKKVIKPGLIKNNLTSLGLSYWYMENGGKLDYTNDSAGFLLYTQKFSSSPRAAAPPLADTSAALCATEAEEVDILINELREKFNLEGVRKENKNLPIIQFSASNANAFIEHILPNIHADFLSKVPGYYKK